MTSMTDDMTLMGTHAQYRMNMYMSAAEKRASVIDAHVDA